MELISRQAAIDALRAMQTYKLFAGDDMLLIDQAGAQTELMLLPPIQPDIVRCKYCKHFEDEYGYCDYYQWNMTGGDFCSKAERREAKT
jgi:hypothetical protein